MNFLCYMIFCLVKFLVFIAATALNESGPRGRLVFTKCVLPCVNKVYYYLLLFLLKMRSRSPIINQLLSLS